MKPRVIGLSGIAGAGKDLFFSLLEANAPFEIKRFALADYLKVEIRDICQQLYGVDILTCSREEKDSVRPFLVAHGKIKRNRSNGRHWIEKAQVKINDFLVKNPEAIACVTDVRYDVFERDEIFWLQKEMMGTLVHISKYTKVDEDWNYPDGRIFGTPPNQDEKENDPKLKAKADYIVEWPTTLNENNQADTSSLNSYPKKFLEFFLQQ